MALAPDAVLSKTPKGREEVETRQHKLEQKLRMLLITANGKLSARELAAQFAKSGDITPADSDHPAAWRALRAYGRF